jgi:hypothetical protein
VGLALAGCEPAPVAEVGPGSLLFASGGDTLFIASRGRALAGVHQGQLLVDALRGGDLTRVFTRDMESEHPGINTLVATTSGEAYFSIVGESRIGRWDGLELSWIEMPGPTSLAGYDASVWAASRDGDELVLLRVEGPTIVEVRREPSASGGGLVRVLPSGHAVWSTGTDTADEVDETGAVVGPATRDLVLARDGVTITVQVGELDGAFTPTFASGAGTEVSQGFRGMFVGAAEGTFDDLDWVLARQVLVGWHSNSDPRFERVNCVLHFDGTTSTERFCTEQTTLVDIAIVHAGSMFYSDGGRIYERPLR